jgi:hypothetical protein
MAAATRQTSRSPSPSRTERSAREDATAEWTRRLSRPELSRAASPRPAPRDGGEVSECRAAPGRVQWRFGPIRCRARRGLAQLYPLCSPCAVLRGYVITSAGSQGACDRRVLRRTDWVAAAASGRAAELPDRPRHQSPARPRCRTCCLRTPFLRNFEQKEPRNRSARVSWWRQQWAAVRVCARVWVPACLRADASDVLESALRMLRFGGGGFGGSDGLGGGGFGNGDIGFGWSTNTLYAAHRNWVRVGGEGEGTRFCCACCSATGCCSQDLKCTVCMHRVHLHTSAFSPTRSTASLPATAAQQKRTSSVHRLLRLTRAAELARPHRAGPSSAVLLGILPLPSPPLPSPPLPSPSLPSPSPPLP